MEQAHEVGIEVLDSDAEIGVLDLAARQDLGDDVLDGVRRDGEADADVGPGRREDRGVDTQDLAVGREAGAAGVASPCASSSGPPELPWLIGASVCRAWSIEKPFGAVMRRWIALMIPAVAVRSNPNGLPIATTSSPT